MPITVVERQDSRQAEVRPGETTIDRVYSIFGSDDDAQVHAAIQAGAPGYYLGLVALGYSLACVGGDVWEATIRYGVPRATDGEGLPDPDAASPGSSLGNVLGDRGQQAALPAFRVTIGGGETQRVTQSLATRHAGKVAGVAGAVPDHKGAIGVNGDEVAGVEIPVASFTWTETRYFPALLIGNAYLLTLFDLAFTTNRYPFRGFPVHSVRFDGADGGRSGLDNWAFTYTFTAQKKLTNKVIDGSTPFDKDGWDYIWFQYEDKLDGKLVKRPKYFYVEQVYEDRDFAELMIGN